MPKMDRSALRAMLSAQKTAAMAATQSSKLSKERDEALMYYMGDMSADLPTIEGRSKAVSTDVADTIEGLMPQLMEIFAGSEEVVEFNPVGPEDVEPARQETDYINHVFMQQNPGFLVLYSFIKDALLSKVGIVKVWWEEREEEENETYYDLTDGEFAMIAADPDVEITEHTENPVNDPNIEQALQTKATHDVTVTKSKTFAEAKVLGVPPEEFGIEKSARSIRTCNYCFHKVLKTESELIAQGYDKTQVRQLPTYANVTNPEEVNRDSVDESQQQWGGDQINQDTRQIEIIEHYIRMDYEGRGKTCLYRVTTGGEADEILKLDGKDDIIEFDQIPFAAMTPIIVTHRFFGRSLADLVKEIQKIKTALFRSLLDNAYLAANPSVEVAESHSSETTLDDLLVSRHGKLIRTKMPGGINWQEVPTIGNFVYPMLEYMDSTREMRTGVTRQGQGIDADALQNQSATAVNQLYSMAQARMRLIARIFAETGIKDLFTLLHATIRKHGQQAQTYRLRNQWVNVDPRQWKKRNDMTVHVGLGSGGKAEQMSLMTLIANYQEKALAGGMTNLVTPQNLYNTAKDLTRIAGKKDVDAYFSDPSKMPPQQQPPDPKLLELQMKDELENKKAQADAQHQMAKLQADAALEQQKFEHNKQLSILEFSLKQEEHKHNLIMKTVDHAAKAVDPETGKSTFSPEVMDKILASVHHNNVAAPVR